jgi:hypothetical protein
MLIPQSAVHKAMLIEKTGAKSIFPLDCYLGISGLPFKITPAAMLKIAYWAQNQLSYQRAEDAIREAMGIQINDDTVRHVSNYVGNVIFHNESVSASKAIEVLDSGKFISPRNLKGVLYIQTDGAALNTRLKNEDGSTWRENKLGEVFSSNNIRYWTDKKGNRQHQLLRKEYVSYVGSVNEFKKHLFSCAVRNGYGKFQETVVLSDGATWIRNMVEEMYPDAQQILDFFHLSENVYTYANHIIPNDEKAAKTWAKNVCEQLKAGKYEDVVSMLQSTKNRLSESSPVNLIGYIINNKRNIDYPEYIKKGYFIGSGAIESGNKIVLQDRLKRAGMRWNVDSAQAMLTLKAKAESNLWYEDVEKPFLEHCRMLSL